MNIQRSNRKWEEQGQRFNNEQSMNRGKPTSAQCRLILSSGLIQHFFAYILSSIQHLPRMPHLRTREQPTEIRVVYL